MFIFSSFVLGSVVCHAGLVSGLLTSAVKEAISGEQGGPSRDRRNAHKAPLPTRPLPPNHPWTTQHILPTEAKPSTHPPSHSEHKPPGQPPAIHPRSQRSPHSELKPSGQPMSHSEPKPSSQPSSHSESKPPGQPPAIHPRSRRSPNSELKPSGHPTSHSELKPSSQAPTFHLRAQWSPQDGNTSAIGMLFGIFQLSNNLACSDGATPSPNMCGLNCSSELKFQLVFVLDLHVIFSAVEMCVN